MDKKPSQQHTGLLPLRGRCLRKPFDICQRKQKIHLFNNNHHFTTDCYKSSTVWCIVTPLLGIRFNLALLHDWWKTQERILWFLANSCDHWHFIDRCYPHSPFHKHCSPCSTHQFSFHLITHLCLWSYVKNLNNEI